MNKTENFLTKRMSRREFGAGLLLNALVLPMPISLLSVPQAQANPFLFLLRLLPFFGRRTLARAASRGLIRSAARATSRQAIRKGATAAGSGGMSLMGTATTAWAAYDIVSILPSSSEAVQNAVVEYEHYPQASERPISVIWDAEESNEILIQGQNFSNKRITDRIHLIIYDVKNRKDIARLQWGAVNLEPEAKMSKVVKIPPLVKIVEAGALVIVDVILERTDPEDVVLEPSDVIVIEKGA